MVMAKHPAPGQVKTRLAAVLGEERACALYRAFVLDLAERLARLPYPVTWAYWPPDAPFPALLPGRSCRPQAGADLGERMASAVQAALAVGRSPVLVLGADVPHVPAEHLAEAAAALATGADVVLGPADDGGYCLIGLRRPAPSLFAGVRWGTSGVLAATLERAATAGLRVVLLAPSFDVDDAADLQRLRTLIGEGTVDLPRTARLLGLAPGA